MDRFTSLEIDALTELVNVGVSTAATRLGRVVRDEVLLSVPALSLVSAVQAAELLSRRTAAPLVAVRERISGDLQGEALLLFPEEASLHLAAAAIGAEEATADPELRNDALCETGNIVLQACIGTISNLVRRSVQLSPPEVISARAEELFARPDEAVLFIYMSFQLRERRITGYVALCLGLPSLGELKSIVGQFILEHAS